MKKKLTDQQLKELSYINDWSSTIINFMIAKNVETTTLRMFAEVINDAFSKQNLKGMKYIFKDINEWAKGMPQHDFEELNKLLNTKFGESLISHENKDLQIITQIVKRGKISNEEEYKLLLSHVDNICNNILKQNEVLTLNKLLVAYHKQ